MKEKIHSKEMPTGTLCEIHSWPSKGLGERLQQSVRARYLTGGINVCSSCMARAKETHAKKV